MTKARGKLLTPAEFASAVGVPRARVYSRLNGAQREFWRNALGVVYEGPRKRHRYDPRDLRIPEESIEKWYTAEPPPGEGSSGRRITSRTAKGFAPPADINRALMLLSRRAESEQHQILLQTFVDVGQLTHLLASRNHQVIFGRRGTGKTHALATLAATAAEADDIPIFIDLRRVGSTGAYASRSVPIEDRCTQLLVDVLATIHGTLVDWALGQENAQVEHVLPTLDDLAVAITTVRVIGTIEREGSSQHSSAEESSASAAADLLTPRLGLSIDRKASRSTVFERRIIESGTPFLDIDFGAVTSTIERIVSKVSGRKIWLLLDEWSSLPIELQPILAEFYRRALLAVPGLIVKIAAIEDRSHFRIAIPDGGHVGLELGADVVADINLDDFMIFDNDSDRAVDFFALMLFKHADRVAPGLGVRNAAEFVQASFGDWGVFRELVRAAEGIPRDAINLAAVAAQRADKRRIGVGDVRAAARDWYQRDKEGALKRPEARGLLARIIDEVVGHRKKRAFLLARGSGGSEDYVVRELYDARILHIIRRGVAPADRPSMRFDGFVVDYGCYVDFQVSERDRASEFWISEVPPERFTLIESSVLDLAQLGRG